MFKLYCTSLITWVLKSQTKKHIEQSVLREQIFPRYIWREKETVVDHLQRCESVKRSAESELYSKKIVFLNVQEYEVWDLYVFYV